MPGSLAEVRGQLKPFRYHAFVRRAFVTLMFSALLACRAHQTAPAPRVIFVGLDGADWQLLDRLMSDGTMPNLARLAREGDRRVLRTQHPPLSPLVWTTMMTGVSPLEHRILDFTRFNPVTREREPITSDERVVPAIWNMASSAGKKVAVFGLWATYPAETVNGTIVSDRLFTFQHDALPAPGCVYPPSQEGWARGVLADVLRSSDRSLQGRVVTETELIHRLARERIARDRPDLAVVYFQGTDAMGHLLAPKVPKEYFARIDAIVGDYAKLAHDLDAQLIIASDHGFDWFGAHGSGTGVTTAAQWHRDEGIYLEFPRRASGGELRVNQICSILLGRLGMPADVEHYRRDYRRARIAAATHASNDDRLAELKALGYLGSAEPSRAPAGSTSTRTAASFDNEGLLLREAGREEAAVAAFESALKIDPHSSSAMWNFASLLVARGRRALEQNDCRAALADFRRAEPLLPRDAIVHASAGTAELCLGDEAAAKREFAASLAIDPNQPRLRELIR